MPNVSRREAFLFCDNADQKCLNCDLTHVNLVLHAILEKLEECGALESYHLFFSLMRQEGRRGIVRIGREESN